MITNLISNNDVFNGILSQSGLNEKMPFLLKKFPGFNNNKIIEISQFDPTSSKIYTEWILKLTSSKIVRMPEDGEKILERLTQFDQLKKKSNFKGEKNINKYDTYADLAKVVDENLGVKTKGEEYREKLSSGMGEVYNDGEYKVIKITTPEAATKLCRGTEWCVKDPKFSESYLKQGPLYRLEKNGLPIALLHFESRQFMDTNDQPLSDSMIKQLSHIISKLNPPLYKLFFSNDSNFNQNDIDIIATSPSASYEYAKDVLKGPFPEGEDAIATDLQLSVDYAFYVLNYNRFIKGEPIISTDSIEAVAYAKNVLKGNRFIEAEPTILKSSFSSYEYAKDVIHGPWPEAEDIIATDAWSALYYAEEVLGKPFPKGEASIAITPYPAFSYAIKILKKPFPEGEDAIATSPVYSLKYVSNILHTRFPKGEDVILNSDQSNRLEYLHYLKNYDPEGLEEVLKKIQEDQNIKVYL